MKTKAFLNNQVQKKMHRHALDFGTQYLPPMGYANGYVAVPPEHPLYGKDYDDVDIAVWGGVTFAARRADCLWDAECIEMIDGGSFADIPQDWWVFGLTLCTSTTALSTIANGASARRNACRSSWRKSERRKSHEEDNVQ